LDFAGDLILLEDQDRSLWDRAMISEGLAQLDAAVRLRQPGPYQIQAAIAACHAIAGSPVDTDWIEIASLYRELYRVMPVPVVRLNMAVAVAMAEGPAAGLRLVSSIEQDGELRGYHLLPAVRADLLRRLGQISDARQGYEDAMALAGSEPERRFYQRRIAECSNRTSSPRERRQGWPV
jgi:RNA polymerase sigma-70 factor (ECF subfamily)